MLIARKIAYNVAVSSFSKILSTALALVSIGLITRYLGKEGFGNYATALAFLSFFSAVADLGLYSASTREISRPGADEKKIMGNIFAFRAGVSLLVLILSPIVVIFFSYPLEVKEAIIIVAASFLFSSSYQILNGVFQKNLAMDKVAISELIGKFFQVLIIFLAVKFDLGFLWIMTSLLFCMILNFILVCLWSRKYIVFKLKLSFPYIGKFLKESYPIGIAVFITFIYFKLDTILLSIIKSSADVGIYNAAYKVIENITFFPAMIIGLIFPIMSKNIFSDTDRFRDISNKTYKFLWIFIVPLLVGTLFLSDGIVKVIGGTSFSESSGVLRILIFALVFIFFGNFSNAILIAGNRQKKLLVVLSIAAIFNVAANLIFIPRYSYLAAAVISALTEMIVVIGTFSLIYKEFKYFPSMKKVGRIILAGAFMAGFIYLFYEINFFLLGLSSIGIYLAALWALRAIKTEEITSIISKRRMDEYGELP